MVSDEARLRAKVERLRADRLEAALKQEQLGGQLEEVRAQLREAEELREWLQESQEGHSQLQSAGRLGECRAPRCSLSCAMLCCAAAVRLP
jgi:hypothetical protein